MSTRKPASSAKTTEVVDAPEKQKVARQPKVKQWKESTPSTDGVFTTLDNVLFMLPIAAGNKEAEALIVEQIVNALRDLCARRFLLGQGELTVTKAAKGGVDQTEQSIFLLMRVARELDKHGIKLPDGKLFPPEYYLAP